MYLQYNKETQRVELVDSNCIMLVPNFLPGITVRKIIKSDSGEPRVELEIYDDALGHTYRTIPYQSLVSINAFKAEMVKQSIFVDPGKAVALHLWISSCLEAAKRANLYEAEHTVLGWTSDNDAPVFMWEKTPIQDGTVSVFADKKFPFRHGDPKKYLDFLKTTVFPKPKLTLALALGFSALVQGMLQSKLDLHSIVINLVGKSSSGKTTASQIAISPFCAPEKGDDRGLFHSSFSTDNYAAQALSKRFGLPAVFDDKSAAESTPKARKQMIYQFADAQIHTGLKSNGKNENWKMPDGVERFCFRVKSRY